jgi:hypothetical protein
VSARRLILIGCQLVVLAAIGGLVTAPTPALAGRGDIADRPERDHGVSPTHLMRGARPSGCDGRLGRTPETPPHRAVSRAVGLLPELSAPPPPDMLGATSDAVGVRVAGARAGGPRTTPAPPRP